jgi:polyferredoxin
MTIKTARLAVQHFCFLLLTYGGRFGVNLGPSLPCLACPFVSGCGGICYLRMLQSPVAGLGLSWPALFGERGLQALLALLLFVVLTALLGQSWCGWICPFGLFQDYVAGIRKMLRLREAIFTLKTLKYLRILKYLLFFYLIITPILITAGLVHPDFTLPFCGICPVKVIMPIFAGDLTFIALDFTNKVLLSMSIILITLTGLTLVGIFLKERFFCLICPMSALIFILKRLFLLNLVKDPRACLGCCTCRNVCPAHLNTADLERSGPETLARKRRLFSLGRPIPLKLNGCHGCFACVETCATDGSLGVKFGRWIWLSSSRRRSASCGARQGPKAPPNRATLGEPDDLTGPPAAGQTSESGPELETV